MDKSGLEVGSQTGADENMKVRLWRINADVEAQPETIDEVMEAESEKIEVVEDEDSETGMNRSSSFSRDETRTLSCFSGNETGTLSSFPKNETRASSSSPRARLETRGCKLISLRRYTISHSANPASPPTMTLPP